MVFIDMGALKTLKIPKFTPYRCGILVFINGVTLKCPKIQKFAFWDAFFQKIFFSHVPFIIPPKGGQYSARPPNRQ